MQCFATLKHWPRKAAKRSVDAVSAATGEVLGTATPTKCRNDFRNAGYGPR